MEIQNQFNFIIFILHEGKMKNLHDNLLVKFLVQR